MTIITIKRATDFRIDVDGYLTDIIDPIMFKPHDVFFEQGQIRLNNDDDFVDELVDEAVDVLADFDDPDFVAMNTTDQFIDTVYEGVAAAIIESSNTQDIITILAQAGTNQGLPCLNCLFYGWVNDELGWDGRCVQCHDHDVGYFFPEEFLQFGTWTWNANQERQLEDIVDADPDDRTFEEQYFSEDEEDNDE
jgi:hypothetical protein